MPWTKYRQPVGPAFLTGAEKQRWAEESVPFFITAIITQASHEGMTRAGQIIEVGPSWVLTVASLDGDVRRVRLGAAEYRDLELADAQHDLEAGVESKIGPLHFRRDTTRASRPFYVIEDAVATEA